MARRAIHRSRRSGRTSIVRRAIYESDRSLTSNGQPWLRAKSRFHSTSDQDEIKRNFTNNIVINRTGSCCNAHLVSDIIYYKRTVRNHTRTSQQTNWTIAICVESTSLTIMQFKPWIVRLGLAYIASRRIHFAKMRFQQRRPGPAFTVQWRQDHSTGEVHRISFSSKSFWWAPAAENQTHVSSHMTASCTLHLITFSQPTECQGLITRISEVSWNEQFTH